MASSILNELYEFYVSWHDRKRIKRLDFLTNRLRARCENVDDELGAGWHSHNADTSSCRDLRLGDKAVRRLRDPI